MNFKMYRYILGYVLKIEAVLMIPSGVISVYMGEYSSVLGFFPTIAAMLIIGALFTRKAPENKVLSARDGLQIAAISWIVMSVFGAIPFYVSGAIPSPLDCIFETVSGFTTTGASILTNIESLPLGILFWRSFTHWIGGMGVLVFILAVISLTGGYSMHIMRAESPGPSTGKLVPKMKKTAKILYSIYIALTLLEVLFLSIGGMPIFDSFVHAFGTAGTGGFSIKNASIGAYGSAYFDYVIAVFMILFGINFNAYFFILIKKYRDFFRSEELRVYLGIIGAAVVLVTLNIYTAVYPSLLAAFRYAFFQVSSIMTTTGYTTANFDQWPELSKMILLTLMICGASAGSTGGGIKVARVIIAFKSAKRELKRMLHPHAVEIVRLEGKTVEEKTITMVNVFLFIYAAIFILSIFLVSIDGYDFETTFSSVAACLNNIGPGLGVVSPAGNYSSYSILSKIVLTLNMLIGRLEIFPILMLLAPVAWKKKSGGGGANRNMGLA